MATEAVGVTPPCEKRCPNPPVPAGTPLAVARSARGLKHLTTPGAQCELEHGHDGPHRNGLLVWHDPPAVYVGGERLR